MKGVMVDKIEYKKEIEKLGYLCYELDQDNYPIVIINMGRFWTWKSAHSFITKLEGISNE